MTQQNQQPITPHLPAHACDMTKQTLGELAQNQSMNEKPCVCRDCENDAGCHAAQSDEVMPRPRKKKTVPPRPRSMTEIDLRYRLALIALAALALVLIVVAAMSYMLGAAAWVTAVSGGGAVTVTVIWFYKTLTSIGVKI